MSKVANLNIANFVKILLGDLFNDITKETLDHILDELKYTQNITHLVERCLYANKIVEITPIVDVYQQDFTVENKIDIRVKKAKKPSATDLFLMTLAQSSSKNEYSLLEEVRSRYPVIGMLADVSVASEIYEWVKKEFGKLGDVRDLDDLLDSREELEDQVKELEGTVTSLEAEIKELKKYLALSCQIK